MKKSLYLADGKKENHPQILIEKLLNLVEAKEGNRLFIY